jgi:hypothetical protein
VAYQYLRLHQIRGFTEEESRRYLTEKEGVPEAFVKAIVAQSPETGHLDAFTWDDPDDRPANVPRSSPFDLALWAALVREQPDLTPEDVGRAGQSGRYAEIRIVGRIRHPALRRLLPAVALLGSFDAFDRATLQAAFGSDVAEPDASGAAGEGAKQTDPAFEAAYQELTQQEWIRRRGPDFLEVDRALRPRLLAYYRESQPGLLETARQRTANHLTRRIEKDPLSRLDLAHFDAALRALAPEPERGAAWWQAIERRFADQQAYDWARTLCEFLLSDEGAAAQHSSAAPASTAESLFRPAVLATYVATLVHTRPRQVTDTPWIEVLHKAPEGSRLARRAEAGVIAGIRASGRSLSQGQVAALWQSISTLEADALDGQLAASLVAALEAVVEQAERPDAPVSIPDPRPVLRLAFALGGRGCPDVEAFAYMLAGRAFLLGQDRQEARRWLERGLSLAVGLTATRQTWLDWMPPADLHARAALELARAAERAGWSPEEVLARLSASDERAASGVLARLRAARPRWERIELSAAIATG